MTELLIDDDVLANQEREFEYERSLLSDIPPYTLPAGMYDTIMDAVIALNARKPVRLPSRDIVQLPKDHPGLPQKG